MQLSLIINNTCYVVLNDCLNSTVYMEVRFCIIQSLEKLLLGFCAESCMARIHIVHTVLRMFQYVWHIVTALMSNHIRFLACSVCILIIRQMCCISFVCMPCRFSTYFFCVLFAFHEVIDVCTLRLVCVIVTCIVFLCAIHLI